VALENYTIRELSYREATDMVVEFHYLHRKAPASYCYGLYLEDKLVGCVIYGKPASPALCKGVAGPEETSHVIELTRLWIADTTPKNAESFLIGNSLRLLPEQYDIVVSYAEIQAGHIGTVYQATNWLYTGMSDKHIQWTLDGEATSKHHRHLFDEHGGINKAKEFFGERMIAHERPRKHRYVMFRGSRARKKELRAKLRYKVQDYPKAEVDISQQ
jgi:hypothetical protein